MGVPSNHPRLDYFSIETHGFVQPPMLSHQFLSLNVRVTAKQAPKWAPFARVPFRCENGRHHGISPNIDILRGEHQ
jgi:hypothetical protein